MEVEIKQGINQILNNNKLSFGNMSYLYTFTNENIKGSLQHFDFNSKDVLTVTGSGDHVLNMLLYVDQIDTFDINLFAYYLLILKKYALIALEKDEFLDFFLNKQTSFDQKKFAKIRSYWQDEQDALSFFEYLFHKYESNGLKATNLFTNNQYDKKEEYIASNSYLDDENYTLLKQTILDKTIIFHRANIKTLSIPKQFDYIHISNITDYLCNMFAGNVLVNYKKFMYQNLYPMLKENGCLICYMYDGTFANFSRSSIQNVLNYQFKEYPVGKDKILVYERRKKAS